MLKWKFRSFVSGHDKNCDPGGEKIRRRPGLSRLTDFLLLLVVVAILTPPAYSRDDRRQTYPNEITVKELERYGRWLNLSPSQQVAARAMHQAYLGKFATLKADVIDPHGPPEVKVETIAEYYDLIKAYLDETEVIRNKIRRVDGALFDEIMGFLDDSQFAAMQRVRDHRAIQTLRVARTISMTLRLFHDVTKFAYELELSQADAALLDPILKAYERRLLNLSRPLHDKALKMETAVYRENIRRGFGGEKRGRSPDQGRATLRDVWRDQGRQVMALILDIDELNETTTRRIEQTLSYEGVQAWLYEYMTRSYQFAGWPREKRRLLMKVIDQAGPLSERDESIFREQLLVFDASLRRLERRMIEIEEGYLPRVHYSMIGEDLPRPNDEYKDDLDEAGKDLDTLVDKFLLQLEQSLSPGGFAKWDAAYAVATKRKSTRPTHANGQDVHRVNRASIFFEARDLKRITRLFDLNNEQQAVLHEAFLAYGKRKTALESDLPEGIWNPSGMEPPLPANLRDRLRQADEIILSALARQLEDESDVRKVDWLRNARRRIRLGREGSPSAAGGVDLVLFILDSGLESEEFETLSPLIDEYDAKAARVYERLFTTYASHYEWFLENQNSKMLSPHQNDLWQERSAVAHLNADSMFVIGEQLDSDAGTAMIELFKRFCYFPVFDDPDRAQPILNRTNGIEDLSPTQREFLLDLKVLNLEEYERLTDAMLDDARYTLYWGFGATDTRPSPTGREESEAYKRHRFLRDELNASTLVKLRTILTSQQLEAMGGLPKK